MFHWKNEFKINLQNIPKKNSLSVCVGVWVVFESSATMVVVVVVDIIELNVMIISFLININMTMKIDDPNKRNETKQ